AGALLDALRTARQGVEEASGPESSSWEARLAEVGRRLRPTFRVQEVECDQELGTLALDFPRAVLLHERATLSLAPDGTRLYLVTAHGRDVFVRVLDVATRRVRRLVTLRAPEVLDFIQVHVTGEQLWIAGHQGALLEVSTVSWDVRFWRGGLPAEKDVVEQVLLVPGTRFHWTSVRSRTAMNECVHIHDALSGRHLREVGDAITLAVVPGEEARVFASRYDKGARLLGSNGGVVRTFPESMQVDQVASSPLPGHLVAVTAAREAPGPLAVRLVTPGGTLLGRVELEDPFTEAPYAIAASSELGLTFVLHHGEDDAEIVALRSSREGLEVAWRRWAPEAAHFIQDIHGRRALLLSVDEGRLRVDTLETPLPAPHTPLSFANDRALPWTGPSFFECLLRERPGLADAAQAACSLPAVARGARIEDLRRA
ncbi:MAG: hypothetical protein L0Y64_13610, partial [Myxococcaceae bacterium]|nr:hypothetical protein [Myxococcaceae bacterium]